MKLIALWLLSIPAFCALVFEPNRGQTDPTVQYLARTSTGVVFVTGTEIVFQREKLKPVRVSFSGARASKWHGVDATGHTTHYFIGRDASKWVRGIESFERVRRANIYPGIDVVFYGTAQNKLEYDLIVAPGADPTQIKIHTDAEVRIDPQTGDLFMGSIRQHKPVIFQNKTEIKGTFKKLGNHDFGFALAAYDHTKPLTIDPVIESREYIGASGDDVVTSVGPGGTASGTTTSVDFPGASGFAPGFARHGTDVFYRTVAFTLILGGSGDETAAPSTLTSNVFQFIGGTTNSRDLPTQTRVPRPASMLEYVGGATDGFIWILDPSFTNGFDPTASYIGTSGEDRFEAVTVVANGFILVGSSNGSGLLPELTNIRPQPNPAGGFDAFVAVGSITLASTGVVINMHSVSYLGGSGDDRAYAVVAQDNGDFVVAGETASSDFPIRGTAVQSQRKGATDGFLARFSSPSNDLFAWTSTTLLGGSGTDRINALAWSKADQTVIAVGTTNSSDFPTVQPFQAVFGGGPSDAFVTAFKADLSQVISSSFFGGSAADEGLAAIADVSGNVFFAGKTASRDFPQRNSVQPNFGGGTTDGFLVHLDRSGSVGYATYFGGSGDDEILALTNASGATVLTGGATTSTDLPGLSLLGTFEVPVVVLREGFVATFSNNVISLPNYTVVGKEARQTVPFGLGDSAKAMAAGRATIESADPSRVLVAFAGLATPNDTALWNLAIPSKIFVECLVDSGETIVTAKVAGYADQTMRVRCVPSELSAILSFGADTTVSLWDFVSVALRIVAVDPLTGERQFMVSSRLNATASIAIANTNPAVASLGIGADPAIGEVPSPISLFTVGETVLTFSSPGFKSAMLSLKVVSPFGQLKQIDLPPGFGIQDRLVRLNVKNPVTVRSLDPSRVLLSKIVFDTPSPSVTIPGFQDPTYWIQLQRGTPLGTEIRLEVSTQGAPTVVHRVVRAVAAVIKTTVPLPATILMTRGEQKSIDLTISTNGAISLAREIPPLVIESSNLTVIAASLSSINGNLSLTLSALGEGAATLTMRKPDGFDLAPELTRPIPVQVSANQITLPDLILGKDLVTSQFVRFPYPLPNSVNFTATTSAPNLIQLRDNLGNVGSIIRGSVTSGNTVHGYGVIGLASQGEGLVTFTATGFPPATAKVQLRPSGYFWESATTAAVQQSFNDLIRLQAAALDPVSLAPLEVQNPSAGAAPVIDSSNPLVATYSRGLSALAVGQTFLTIRQPSGFSTPSVRQRMQVVVRKQSDPVKVSLRLTITGSGSVSGTVACSTSTPCIQIFDRFIQVALTAKPASGYLFAGWSGEDCPNAAAATCNFAVFRETQLTASFIPDPGSLHFVPVAPCRLVDTRNAPGPLGGPALAARSTRSFPLRSACGLSANAKAYSLNITVVPRGPLSFISVWPGGEPQPLVSTLNAVDGRIKANAAIVSAGENGSVNVYATDLTDVIIDVNGVFVLQGTDAAVQAFYPITPCRVADTRQTMIVQPLTNREFSVRNQPCLSGAASSAATALVLNVTVVPKTTLGYLTLWPANQPVRPVVSTLNALTGTVVANMAIMPIGGALADFTAYVTEATDLIVDVTGYFARPGGEGALNFHTLTPCRALDTRTLNAPLAALSTRDISIPCGVPATAKAYSMNATVLPTETLGFLTLYPTGVVRHVASTLNAVDGSITSNAAIIPAGVNGSISVYVTGKSHLILDINGYFAP